MMMDACGAYETILDSRGAIVAIGTRIAALVGLAPSELIGRPVTRILRGAALTASAGQPGALVLRTEQRGPMAGIGVRVIEGERVSITFVPELPSSLGAARSLEPESRVVGEAVREVHDALTGVIGFTALAQTAATPHMRQFYHSQTISQADRTRRLVQVLDPQFQLRPPLTFPVDLSAKLIRALAGTRSALERSGVAFDVTFSQNQVFAACDARQVCDMVIALILRATTGLRSGSEAQEVTVSLETVAGLVRVSILLTGADSPQSLLRENFGSGPEAPSSMSASELELRAHHLALGRQGGQFDIFRDSLREEVVLTISVPAAPAISKIDDLRTPVPLHVLCIDENAMIGELYSEMLATSGHTVTAVKSIYSAREALREQRFDVVISEFYHRDGNLPELWAMAAEVHPELKSRLLVITREPRDPRLIEWASEHRVNVLAKPFSMATLVDMVTRLGG